MSMPNCVPQSPTWFNRKTSWPKKQLHPAAVTYYRPLILRLCRLLRYPIGDLMDASEPRRHLMEMDLNYELEKKKNPNTSLEKICFKSASLEAMPAVLISCAQ